MALNIWQADCSLLDAVLTLSFDTRELLNGLHGAGIPVPPCSCRFEAATAVGTVHHACHSDTPLARLIERRLNLVHRESLQALARDGVQALREELLHTELWSVADLPGRLWALTVCDDPAAEEVRTAVRALLTLTGLRLLADRRGAVA